MLEIRMIALGYGQVIKNKFLLTKAGKKKMSQIKKKLVGTEVAISFTPGYRARSRNGI